MLAALDVVFSESALKAKVDAIAAEISRDYHNKELILVGVLKGSVFFVADLIRRIEVPLKIDFISIALYPGEGLNSNSVKIIKDLEEDIKDKDVLLVEDFVDTGVTLHNLIQILELRRPSSLKVCALLDRVSRRSIEVPIAYKGFAIGDDYLVGYGMDWEEQWRSLPYIAKLKR